jgi:dihydroorotase-like cyclic amidohydrolase
MRIKLEVYDVETGETLEEIGECLTDSPNRAVQMYDEDEKWIEQGYNADIRWIDITNEAARALRAIPSETRSEQSRINGKLGGRPRKVK